MILNIETSSKFCSVALSEAGAVWFSLESDSEMDHSVKLAPFVERCMTELRQRGRRLEAVAVSMGPGSYTGLRIGFSLAKGLCFGSKIPLIGINTLKILAVKGIFADSGFEESTLYVPLIDARRMEVYTAVYNNALEEIVAPTPLIITENSFEEFSGKNIVFIGDGVEKAKPVINLNAKKWLFCYPKATDMIALSEKAVRERDYLDLAYSTPFYLKNFQATTPKKNIL